MMVHSILLADVGSYLICHLTLVQFLYTGSIEILHYSTFRFESLLKAFITIVQVTMVDS